MSADLETLRSRLKQARDAGDRVAEADAHARLGARAVDAGRFAQARDHFDRAAELEEGGQRRLSAARARHLGATAARLAGDSTGAARRAREALTLAPDASPPQVAALTEMAEQAAAAGEHGAAAERLAEALDAGESAGLKPGFRVALLRRLAVALTAAGRSEDAALTAFEAGRTAEEAGEQRLRLEALIDEATAWAKAGKPAHAAVAREKAQPLAERIGDRDAQARLALLVAADALDRGAVADARRAAEQARSHALASRSAPSYIGAVLVEARAAEAGGDRVAAYGALAVGRVTLRDLLGSAAASATFDPHLRAAVERWGEPGFIAARDAYGARRSG